MKSSSRFEGTGIHLESVGVLADAFVRGSRLYHDSTKSSIKKFRLGSEVAGHLLSVSLLF